jgi:FtsP/CotA-like multicopper oxidase with cupredoxin domain
MRGRLPLSRRLLVSVLATIIAFPVGSWPPAVEGTTGGSPYDIPSVIDTNGDANIVETTITANETDVSIGGGVTAHAYTYNDTIPGPEFRLTVGQRVIVHFNNELTEPTGIHWHGIELQNPSDGTPLTQNQVPAGGSFTYDFVVRRPGVYWYHPHHEFSTNQVFKGLYGSIIVTDPNESALITAGKLPSLANTRTLALSDMTVCKAPTTNDTATYNPALPWAGPGGILPVQQTPTPAWLCEAATALDNHGELKGSAWAAGDIPNIQRHSQRVNEGQTVLTNGVNVGARAGTPAAPGAVDPGAYKLAVAPGQGLRLRIGNAATTRFFHLHLTNNLGIDQPLYRVGGEGGLLDAVELDGKVASGFDFDYNEGEILLDPGDRTDVVIAFPLAAAGVWTLWTEDFRRSGGGDSATGWMNLPTVPVAHFDLSLPALVTAFSISEGTGLRSSTGDPVQVLPPATGHLLDPLLFPTPELGSPLENIRITTSGGHPGIDGVAGTHDFTIDYTEQPHGDASRWALIGDVLQLTVTNESPADHPFHLHGFSIQPLTLTNCQVFGGGATPNYTFPHEFMDNIDIPGNCTLTLRVRLDDRAFPNGSPGGGLGGWMFHCHIFFHHHQGMVSELIVLRPAVTITNVAPAAVVPINTLVTVTTEVLGTAPTYNWDDLGATSVGTHTLGAEYTASHTFTQAGVYTVTATVANTVFPASDSVMIVVYDPSAGFVTGGGTITSGAGAYVASASLTGTASFGFVSKYKKGANIPDGDTEFNFHVASFNFHSTAYQWLVVAGAKAQYKGTGTVNGTGHYGFLLSAVDGQLNGGGGTDKFRIKIWDMDNGDAVVYDNNLGASEDIDNANPQIIKSGSIVIHSN